MKKFLLMLLCVAATTHVMAVTTTTQATSFTAKATLTMTSASGYCDVTIAESPSYGALDGIEMNMEDRKIALYVVKGTDTLQVALAASFEGVRVGLKTDVTTHYTVTVSGVEGSETLYLYDSETDEYHALTDGTSFSFDATANTVNNSRFSLTKNIPTPSTPTVFTARATITLTSKTNGSTCNLTVAESASFGDLMGSEMNMEGRKVAIYVLNGTDTLQVVRAKSLEGAIVGIKTDASTDYTISASYVEGETLYLHDESTGQYLAMNDGASYDITLPASTITGHRFTITKTVIEDAPLKVCFNNDVLEIIENSYTSPIVIKNQSGNTMISRPAGTTSISLTELAPGIYTAEFNNGNRKFIIEKK